MDIARERVRARTPIWAGIAPFALLGGQRPDFGKLPARIRPSSAGHRHLVAVYNPPSRQTRPMIIGMLLLSQMR